MFSLQQLIRKQTVALSQTKMIVFAVVSLNKYLKAHCVILHGGSALITLLYINRDELSSTSTLMHCSPSRFPIVFAHFNLIEIPGKRLWSVRQLSHKSTSELQRIKGEGDTCASEVGGLFSSLLLLLLLEWKSVQTRTPDASLFCFTSKQAQLQRIERSLHTCL